MTSVTSVPYVMMSCRKSRSGTPRETRLGLGYATERATTLALANRRATRGPSRGARRQWASDARHRQRHPLVLLAAGCGRYLRYLRRYHQPSLPSKSGPGNCSQEAGTGPGTPGSTGLPRASELRQGSSADSSGASSRDFPIRHSSLTYLDSGSLELQDHLRRQNAVETPSHLPQCPKRNLN